LNATIIDGETPIKHIASLDDQVAADDFLSLDVQIKQPA
jgi:hypothetical protein